MGVRVGGRLHGVPRHGDAAVGAVLEAHRQGQAADQLAVDLGFCGAGADRRPAEKVFQVACRQRAEQLAGQRQAQAGQITQQCPAQAQAFRQILAAVQVRIVEQPFPAHRGARLLHVGAHHQQGPVADPVGEGGEPLAVFRRRVRIVQRARAGDDQQTIVLAIEDVAHRLALGGDARAQGGVHGQPLAELPGAGQPAAHGPRRGCRRVVGGDGGKTGVHSNFLNFDHPETKKPRRDDQPGFQDSTAGVPKRAPDRTEVRRARG